MSDWTLNPSDNSTEISSTAKMVLAKFENASNVQSALYWVAPQTYLGNRVSILLD